MFKLKVEKARADTFDRLVRPHVSHLYQLASRLSDSVPEAEDLVQDVLIKLYSSTDQMGQVDYLKPWLAKVLYHQFLDEERKKTRRPHNHSLMVDLDECDHRSSLNLVPLTTSEIFEQGRDSQKMWKALNQLKPPARALIVLYHIDGFTLQEMAQILDVPAETIRTRLRRSRFLLRKYLKN